MMTFEQVKELAIEIEDMMWKDLTAEEQTRFEEIEDLLYSEEAKVFVCSVCGESCGFFDLEIWGVEELDGAVMCHSCYEEDMGEDL